MPESTRPSEPHILESEPIEIQPSVPFEMASFETEGIQLNIADVNFLQNIVLQGNPEDKK